MAKISNKKYYDDEGEFRCELDLKTGRVLRWRSVVNPEMADELHDYMKFRAAKEAVPYDLSPQFF